MEISAMGAICPIYSVTMQSNTIINKDGVRRAPPPRTLHVRPDKHCSARAPQGEANAIINQLGKGIILKLHRHFLNDTIFYTF